MKLRTHLRFIGARRCRICKELCYTPLPCVRASHYNQETHAAVPPCGRCLKQSGDERTKPQWRLVERVIACSAYGHQWTNQRRRSKRGKRLSTLIAGGCPTLCTRHRNDAIPLNGTVRFSGWMRIGFSTNAPAKTAKSKLVNIGATRHHVSPALSARRRSGRDTGIAPSVRWRLSCSAGVGQRSLAG